VGKQRAAATVFGISENVLQELVELEVERKVADLQLMHPILLGALWPIEESIGQASVALEKCRVTLVTMCSCVASSPVDELKELYGRATPGLEESARW